jgi:hypothetical protein
MEETDVMERSCAVARGIDINISSYSSRCGRTKDKGIRLIQERRDINTRSEVKTQDRDGIHQHRYII